MPVSPDSELDKRRWIFPVEQVEAAVTAAKDRFRQASTSQQKHLAGLDLTPAACPLCHFPLVPAVAAAAGQSMYGSGSPKEHHACPRCGVRLRLVIPLVALNPHCWELSLTDSEICAVIDALAAVRESAAE